MQTLPLPLEPTDWSRVDEVQESGESGHAICKTRTFGDIRLRLIDYTPGFVAASWCLKKHIMHCIAGAITVHVQDRPGIAFQEGMSLVTDDDGPPHRLSTEIGAVLLIVD
jgi:hypothetical protein